MAETDALIIGASLAGCITAKHAARKGIDVTVLEEHRKVGKQGQCTALVSASGLPSLGVKYKPSVVHQVKGAFLHAPHATLEVRAPETKAFVLDRQKFDEQCAREAREAGARIMLDEAALKYTGNSVRTHKHRWKTRVLVGADGASSWCAREQDFPAIPSKKYALCYEAEFSRARVDDEEMVHMFLDRQKFPGFFAWLVPTGGGARIGLGTTRHKTLSKGREALFNHPLVREAIGKARQVKEFHALIPLQVREKTQLGTTLLVGDAAGQVKATTGGGWVYGGNCAKLAGENIAAYLQEEAPLEYERIWRAKYGRHLKWHSRLRTLLDSMGNHRLDALVASLSVVKFNRLLEKFGDMDFVVKR